MKPNEVDALIEDSLEGCLSESDAAKLSALLERSAEARSRYWEAASIHGMIEHTIQSASLRVITGQALPVTPKRGRWLNWRPILAAAAGLVLGMFCTSVVFAYVVPMRGKVVTLLEDGFESAPAPMATGVPIEAGRWSGDFAEIVGPQNGVLPHGGTKMWRFLRADSVVDSGAQPSYVGEAIRVVDLRSLRTGGVKAGSQIEISAWFAAGKKVSGSLYHWNIKAAAFEGSIGEAANLWGKWEDASTSLARREVPAEQTGRWQRVSVTMSLPPNADFLVFECAVVQRLPVVSQGVAQFPAHYLDDVHVRVLPPTREANALE